MTVDHRMGVSNLSIVFGPNLIDSRSANSDNMLGSKIVESLILNADYFFPNGNSFYYIKIYNFEIHSFRWSELMSSVEY